MDNQRISFRQFLSTAFDKGDYATDDVIAFVLPFLEELASFHENNLVAPFDREDLLFITENRLDIDENLVRAPMKNEASLKKLFEAFSAANFEVVGRTKVETDVSEGHLNYENLNVHLDINEPLTIPAYTRGYNCFESLAGHHDAQTDIFCAGLVLGSIALGLDLYDDEDVRMFAEYRRNPVQYNQRIHPTISTLITEMTELDRHRRSQDLYDVINRLKNYRDFDPEKQTDLSKVAGWVNKELKERSQFILNKLRNRLFDTSRRNRLLYYKPNMRFVNLTVSSVPMVLHYQSIRPDLLFTWNTDVSAKVTGMKEIVLNRYLRFEDHVYLGSSLDKIRLESQRDVQEFGFSQLKLVITYLNWHNLKEEAHERIQSPLLLIPVELKKTKRLKEDHYGLKILDNSAEVNPVLANQLKELYGIRLPDFVDLDEMTLDHFYSLLKAQIDAANQGIQLQYIQKPKIKLIHSVAKQTLSNYRRRLRKKGEKLDSYKNISYSYQRENYKPLGLEIYRQRIEPRSTFLEFLINDDIKVNAQRLTGTNERERELFQLVESESNPYSWDFDVCNIVLGNFNYKKMSLVRDYNQVIDNNLQHVVFEELFSNQPKKIEALPLEMHKPNDWHHVITADPTQTQAILKSRTGESYIIQGPPGTGKSQTITNLIADFAARGKSVLFVCEKRAALDVVFHRLKQNGLDELCCYIHDSQGDKREFIKNLKATYEEYTTKRMDLTLINRHRTELLDKMGEALEILKQFHDTNLATTADAGVQVRKLIDRLVELREMVITLQPHDAELMPGYGQWMQFGAIMNELSRSLEEMVGEEIFAYHPLSKVNDAIYLHERPINVLSSSVKKITGLYKEIESVLLENAVAADHRATLSQLKNLVQDAILLQPLAEHGNVDLVDIDGARTKEFERKIASLRESKKAYDDRQQTNKLWLHKLSEQDLVNATSIAEKNEGSFFSFLNGPWRKLKKQLKTSYDFAGHQVNPSIVSILKNLKQEYEALHAVNEARKNLQVEYNLENVDTAYLGIELLRSRQDDKEIDYLLHHPDAARLVRSLCRINQKVRDFEQELGACLSDIGSRSLLEVRDDLESISLNIDSLQEILPVLKRFASLPEELKKVLRKLPLSMSQMEAAMANKSLMEVLHQNRTFANTDLAAIERSVSQIRHYYRQLLKLNAELIRAGTRQRFTEHIEISNTALSQLNNEQRQFKKNYNEGRKILENEFGKSMRYKSIRELTAKESGLVLRDLKPVWLMSPLSVSDSLPLNTSFFDVVIFDEASQITLEEGIPSLYRSSQTIIVGDDKQMPPTNFFTARTQDPDDLESIDDETEDELLSADADSLLVQGSRKLNSTMLSWHYRSRYETLISYSNHAFYEAGLLTIPDKTIHHNEKPAIEVLKPEDAVNYAMSLFDRSISFHFHPASVYEKRSNVDEANYIAHLVRELLRKKVKDSIGIVAFSQEQQQTIEDALTNLAQQDKEFEQLLEEAFNRTEDDQFVGLIIKNLENIQGDERDIIIMSVCYGFDSRRKVLMNFGPINKKGGEKRLNVIFSRAKKHMAIVSSLKYINITNEYNEGANYFRRFLQYAENVSCGNMATARMILDGLVVKKKQEGLSDQSPVISRQIKLELEKQGFEIAEQVGQSNFKCSLAVKVKPGDDEYTLSILVDDDGHYSNPNVLEQYFQRPAILEAFGWRSIHVFAKDWWQNPGKVMEQILKRIKESPRQIDIESPVVNYEINQAAQSGINTEVILDNEPVILTAGNEPPFERYVYMGEGSNKFWEIAVNGVKLTVRFGRTGTKGQMQVKSYADSETAIKEKEKLVKEKTSKGYRRQLDN